MEDKSNLTALNRIGVLAHPTRPQTAEIAERIAAHLRGHGVDTWCAARWDDQSVKPQVADADMIVAIGGDGAMLRAARVCAPFGVPILGVNTGRLGFLTEIREPEAWNTFVHDVLDGNYWVEQRMMLRVSLWRGDTKTVYDDALNDVVISRGNVTRTIHLDAYVDGGWITTYNADALIVATATGSTAYALACGGPILPPELRSILLVPVAPHLTLDRPIVLPEGAVVEVVVSPDTMTEIVLATDGTPAADLRVDDRVQIQASAHISRFVRLRDRNYFYRSILDRLEPRIAKPSNTRRTPG